MWPNLKEQLAAKDEVVKAKEEQVSSLSAEVQELHTIRPVQIRDHILTVARRLGERAETLQPAVSEAEKRVTEIDALMNDQRSEIALTKARLIELEERRRNIQQFIANLREMVNRQSTGDRSQAPVGESAIRAVEAEHSQVLASIGEQQAKVASCEVSIDAMESERAIWTSQLTDMNHQISSVMQKQEQLRAALEIMLSSDAAPDSTGSTRAAAAPSRFEMTVLERHS